LKPRNFSANSCSKPQLAQWESSPARRDAERPRDASVRRRRRRRRRIRREQEMMDVELTPNN
jgi:hypothetical protein